MILMLCLLIADLKSYYIEFFQYRIEDDKKGVFDDAQLMLGVGEKGVDIALTLDSKNVGAIQCKMNTSGNINKPPAAKEIIKFVLHYLKDKSLIHDISTFQYYFVASDKLADLKLAMLQQRVSSGKKDIENGETADGEAYFKQLIDEL